jgi:hypothetical protein
MRRNDFFHLRKKLALPFCIGLRQSGSAGETDSRLADESATAPASPKIASAAKLKIPPLPSAWQGKNSFAAREWLC